MPVEKLRFTSVGPFDKAQLEFDKNVNVFVGPNNCGKSVTLMVLGEILVYPFSIPQKYFRKKKPSYHMVSRVGRKANNILGPLPVYPTTKEKWKTHVRFLGTIGYSTFIPALRRSTDFRAQGPGIQRTKRRREEELEIPSRALSSLSDKHLKDYIKAKRELLEPEIRRRAELITTEASIIEDEAIIQKIIDLDYMAYRQKRKGIRQIIDDIANISSEITEGFPIGFAGVDEDEKGLFPKFKTPDGDIPLNCLSQGTQSIMQWLAHLLIGYAEYYDYPRNMKEKPGILIVDEIDAHLHPSWQKHIIPTLVRHFPNLQIFSSTHSPLMIAGLRAGQVHLMRRERDGKVSVTRNETDILGWSADEILRCFMDVSSPTDLETSQAVERLQRLRRRKQLTAKEKAELNDLRGKIGQNLLGGPAAVRIDEIRKSLKDKMKK